jgi:hypothetical protein
MLLVFGGQGVQENGPKKEIITGEWRTVLRRR